MRNTSFQSLRRGTWTACLYGGVLIALAASRGTATAAEPTSAARYQIDQPAQPVSSALRAIASQTGISVLFVPETVGGLVSRAVSGRLSAIEAVSRALDGTGLTMQVTSDLSIVVKPSGAGASHTRAALLGSQDIANGASGSGRPLANMQPFVVAQSSASTPIDSGASADRPASTPELERVEVTGSRLKRIDGEGPTPVNVYTRAEIDRSGQPTLDRFLSSLNESSVSPGEGGLGQTTGQGAVQLRGLPLGSTLVLINGRRVQAVGSSSGNFFNLNLIPMAAVDRVEIVPVGSSAVYGGDALAGVVNVILKKSIDGFALDARLGAGKGFQDGGVSLVTGQRDEDKSFILIGSYTKSSPLTMALRSFFQRDFRSYDVYDARTERCTPGTVRSTTAANLPGLNSTVAGIPSLQPGQTLNVGSFAATDGRANLCNDWANGHGTALVHGSEDFAIHGAGELRLGTSWTAFGELTFTSDRQHAEESGLQVNNALVAADNPYNPFGSPVLVTSRLGIANGAEGLSRKTNFTRALVGVRGDIVAGWEFEASLSTTRDDGERRLLNDTVNAAALNAALGSTLPASALNPFTTGVAASNDVLQSIWSDTVRESHGRKDQASAFVRGSALALPGGSVDVIAGLEMAHDRYQTASPGLFDIEGARTSRAIFGEARAPIFRMGGAGANGWDAIALTVAGRRDVYSDFGGASTYQAGLELRPVRTLLLRASGATSFKPPTLLETHVDDTSYASESFGLLDPARGNESVVGADVLRTTNRSLAPEKGKAVAFGAVWEPESATGTRFGVTAWRVKIDGLISILWPQVTLDHEDLFPGLVTRAPSVGGVPGAITRILYTEVNFGSVDTAGADLEVSHSWRAAGGKWNVAASATRTTKYEITLTPGAPAEDRLGVRAYDYWAPRWKGRLSASVDTGAWNLGITNRYLGAYRDAAPSDRDLGNYWVHDLAGSVDLKRLGWGFRSAKSATLSMGIVNVANRLPEVVGSWPYYDITQADWRGRYGTVRLSVNW